LSEDLTLGEVQIYHQKFIKASLLLVKIAFWPVFYGWSRNQGYP
jgi:hypothetical protein